MIETNRLILKPLNYKQLQEYIKLDQSLEKSLKLTPAKREITPDLMEVLEYSILPNVENPLKNHLFFTLWTVIWKKENCLVGDLCFVGEPNELGEVELGYGTYKDFRNQGFMTEAVMGLVNWIKPYINAILASCEKENLASSKILEKNGFIVCGHENNLIHWRLDVQK